jgi:hypothetical protein
VNHLLPALPDSTIKRPPRGYFYLVESRALQAKEDYKAYLNDDDTFSSEFIGASAEDCQAWARERQYQVNLMHHNIIAIADARSANDETLLIQVYKSMIFINGVADPLTFPGWGVLPKEHDVWYDFRIDYKCVGSALFQLDGYGPLETIYPTWFGRKEELTNELGVFADARADSLVKGEDLAFLKME